MCFLVQRVKKYLNMKRGFLCRSLLNTDKWVCGLSIKEMGFTSFLNLESLPGGGLVPCPSVLGHVSVISEDFDF